MRAVWYCTDCGRRIDLPAIEDHESRGHHVSGQLRPDRLLGNDPWNVTLATDTDAAVSESSDTSVTNEEVTD